jgi:hypothetical protein
MKQFNTTTTLAEIEDLSHGQLRSRLLLAMSVLKEQGAKLVNCYTDIERQSQIIEVQQMIISDLQKTMKKMKEGK